MVLLEYMELKMKSKLKVLLAEKDLTQQELCQQLKLDPHFISKLANGKVKRFETKNIEKLLSFFNCQIQDLIYWEKTITI